MNQESRMMVLFIDTSQRDDSYLALIYMESKAAESRSLGAGFDIEEGLLPAIDQLFKDDGGVLYGIIVITGPGGFTSLRMGVTVANILGWTHNIPVYGAQINAGGALKLSVEDREAIIRDGLKQISQIREFRPVMPEYGKEPNITSSYAFNLNKLPF